MSCGLYGQPYVVTKSFFIGFIFTRFGINRPFSESNLQDGVQFEGRSEFH